MLSKCLLIPETVPICSEPTHSIDSGMEERQWRVAEGGWTVVAVTHIPTGSPCGKPAGDAAGAPPALGPPPARLSNTFNMAEHPGALPVWTGGQKRERLFRVMGLVCLGLGAGISAELRRILPESRMPRCKHSGLPIPWPCTQPPGAFGFY